MNSDIDVLPAGALDAMTRGEIDIQIATAKRYPRNIPSIKSRLREMATLDAETAEECVYRLPSRKNRDGEEGKPIEGPSIRLAEIAVAVWGNIRAATRITSMGERTVVAQAVVIDLETNVAMTVEAQRSIVNRYGKRYGDDMINVTAAAAQSIALRNAVFKVVPKAIVKPVADECKRFAVAEQERREAEEAAARKSGKSNVDSRKAAVQYFVGLGASEDEALGLVGAKSVDDLTPNNVVALRQIAGSIQRGEFTLADAIERSSGDRKGPEKSKRPPDDYGTLFDGGREPGGDDDK